MTTLQLLSVIVAVAALFGLISTRTLRLPLTIGTMLLTVLGALGLEAASAWFPALHPRALTRQLAPETAKLRTWPGCTDAPSGVEARSASRTQSPAIPRGDFPCRNAAFCWLMMKLLFC